MEYAKNLRFIEALYGKQSIEYLLWQKGGKFCRDGKGHRDSAYLHEDLEHGSIQISYRNLPPDHVRLYDISGTSWTGPARTAHARLAALPDHGNLGGGINSVWIVFPKESFAAIKKSAMA